jgi:CRISPR-associated protein Cmr3
MTRALYTIEPFDTTAFRDGRPFEQDDQGLAETVSVFPPPPPAIAGAVMVALAQAIGVPRGDWRTLAGQLKNSNDEAEKKRGHNLAAIFDARITGPFVARWDGADGWAHFVRCPADLLFKAKAGTLEAPVGYFRPSGELVHANIVGEGGETAKLKRVLFPRAEISPDDKGKATAAHFMTLEAIGKYLRNRTPPNKADVVAANGLSFSEARIGIAVDKSNGVAKASQLYAAEHRRLSSANKEHRFLFAAEGPKLKDLQNQEIQIDCIVPFGGEGRFARVRGPFPRLHFGKSINHEIPLLDGRYVAARITALTPIPVTEAKNWGLDLSLADSLKGAKIIGAVHDRPQSMGFIARADYQTGKMTIIRVFPAGSTWFLKVPAEKHKEQLAIRDPAADAEEERLAAPDLALYGFGRFLAGII